MTLSFIMILTIFPWSQEVTKTSFFYIVFYTVHAVYPPLTFEKYIIKITKEEQQGHIFICICIDVLQPCAALLLLSLPSNLPPSCTSLESLLVRALILESCLTTSTHGFLSYSTFKLFFLPYSFLRILLLSCPLPFSPPHSTSAQYSQYSDNT